VSLALSFINFAANLASNSAITCGKSHPISESWPTE
jgi:hypothetical protein